LPADRPSVAVGVSQTLLAAAVKRADDAISLTTIEGFSCRGAAVEVPEHGVEPVG
jgi:hypothetical protein